MTDESKTAGDGAKEKYDWKFRLLLAVAPRLAYAALYTLFRSCRIEFIGKENEDQFLREGKPSLFVSWHQGLLYFPFHFRNRYGVAMVSRSKDGELIDRTVKLFGFRSARGSSSRDGKAALDVMIEMINRLHCSGGITADAPRGPFGEAKIGIIKLGKETGVPLLPIMWWAKRKILLKNWDKTIVPMPFTRVAFFVEEPIYIPADATREQMEKARVDLTDLLNRMHKQAREYFGDS
jgi:lysophospholipid acyltransferase (LPLAT)-like uncharacterized protein